MEPGGIIRPLGIAEVGRAIDKRIGGHRSPVRRGQIPASFHHDETVHGSRDYETKLFPPRQKSNFLLKRPTVGSFIALLESTHLIHRLLPFGYDKQVLRARAKIYLADAAIAPSVLLKGKALLEDSDALNRAVETAFFKHVFTRYYAHSVGFSYWRGKQDREVDIIADLDGRLVPFEVKYRAPQHTGVGDLKGMAGFCAEHKIETGCVSTREMTDFQVMEIDRDGARSRLLKIPAPLACYWLGRSELESANRTEV